MNSTLFTTRLLYIVYVACFPSWTAAVGLLFCLGLGYTISATRAATKSQRLQDLWVVHPALAYEARNANLPRFDYSDIKWAQPHADSNKWGSMMCLAICLLASVTTPVALTGIFILAAANPDRQSLTKLEMLLKEDLLRVTGHLLTAEEIKRLMQSSMPDFNKGVEKLRIRAYRRP